MTALLQVHELAGGYPGVDVFSGVTFSVGGGEILTVLGANGSGKSALLQVLQGVLTCQAGSIVLDSRPVQHLPAEERAALGMTLVSDRRWLWHDLTVFEHLRLGAFRRAARPGWRGRTLELYRSFPGLPARHRTVGLSGGVQQQVALARSGMSCPRVWLLDDPLQGLDEEVAGRTLEWIHEAVARGGAVIVTGQHIRALLAIGHKAMFLQEGTLRPLPTGAIGLRDPRVQALL